ncbi:MAG: hypothetical protein JWN86_3755 [Planctomycetota bacterium]|nr:hypothetical protein [Planctomycetota bacterium]
MPTLTETSPEAERQLPPVISRLLRGTFWLALRTPLQAVFVLWSVPLIVNSVGQDVFGAFGFAWGFGFLQFLLEFGMSSALQKEVSACWTRGDRQGVDRAVACGMNFYAAMALVQAAALLGIAYFGIPSTFGADSSLIVKLLWLQALTAPCYGISTVLSSVLQAARRYDFLPRFELVIVILRFLVLVVGLKAHVDFFWIVAAQTVVSVGFSLGPMWWVIRRELHYRLPWRGAKLSDYRTLIHVSTFMFVLQLSVVMADRIDIAILGYALPAPKPAIAVYQGISKPFLQLRQTGWMLAYLVMPAVASLAAAKDQSSLERIKYDGTRLLMALILPVGLLAGLYAHPFLELWVPKFAHEYRLMQLFLVAALPLVLSVLVQMAIGMNAIKLVAISALVGAAVNLPVSYVLTVKFGVAGVIWGTVLTTLFSNLIVPGIHVFRVLGVRPRTFLRRSLGAPLIGAAAMVAATLALQSVWSAEPGTGSMPARAMPLLAHLVVGVIAYVIGYLSVPEGRGDLAVAWGRLLRSKTAAVASP